MHFLSCVLSHFISGFIIYVMLINTSSKNLQPTGMQESKNLIMQDFFKNEDLFTSAK